jgi:class 3 adenylate cyclase/CheY-like chemotaxis protein
MEEISKSSVLIVDDTEANVDILVETLGDDYDIAVALDGETALEIIAESPPDLVLLDIMMPVMDGYEVCRRLQAEPATAGIPVIFLSAMVETADKTKGFDLGAVDYITKPFEIMEVKARVQTHLSLQQARRELAQQNDILESKVRQRTAELAALNAVYEKFVPREFLSLLGKKSIMEIERGDQIRQEMTVLFSDIRSWTTLSESMSPQENFKFINAYLKRVSPKIKEHHGFIDQYYGDGVMALFPGRADDAVQAAVAMLQAVEGYNQERRQDGLQPIGIGVGLHIGNLMLGIIGSEERLQGAVVADAVNLAARIEGLTKLYGSSITISEEVLSHLENPIPFKHRFLDKVLVKGKDTPVTVYEIFDGDPEMIAQLKLETKPSFEAGLSLYYDRRFAEASVQFNQVLAKNPEDKAAMIYLKRSAQYMVQGVPADWTGVEILLSK